MRIIGILIACLLLGGCAARIWVPLRGQTEAEFRQDVLACGGEWLVAPVIMLPVLYPLWSEAKRQCLESRGYAQRDESLPPRERPHGEPHAMQP